MVSRFARLRGILLRLILIIGVVFTQAASVQPSASAQGSAKSPWVVRSLYTSEFGVNAPKGLAFSPVADTFLVLDGSANISLITMDEDHGGIRNVPDAQNDPLNVAFDQKSDSLFVFKRDKSELVKIKAANNGLPNGSVAPTRFSVGAYNVKDPQGIAFDSDSGRLFVLDAGKSQILAVTPHATLGFDPKGAKVQQISLKKLGTGSFRGVAFNPNNGHLYVSEPARKKLYELTQNGDLVSTFDLASLGINNPSAMTFAPSVDNTDDPNIYDLFVLEEGQTGQAAKSGIFARPVSAQQTAPAVSQIVELSLVAPMALPPGTTLLPTTLVNVIDTSNAAWSPSAPDPAGVDYWQLTGRLLISDSEVDEMPPYWQGKNVFQSTTSGTLVNTCSTMAFTSEPTGVAINQNNNHIFFSTDLNDRIFEVSLGADGQYCTADDTLTSTNVSSLYGITDAEDVAYGNNTVFVGGGTDAEVYSIPLGANGVLGGGDDGAMTHFDTAALGFADMEALGYNPDSGTLFIASTKATDRYLGETTTSGTLVNAYDLALMGSAGNIRSDVTYAPGSQNPAIKNIYIASRGIDNDTDPNENDGRVWEINIGSAAPTPTNTPTAGPSPTPTFTSTPTLTSTITPTPTITPTVPVSGNPLYVSFTGTGTLGTVTFADEDIVKFDGSTWSMFFDGGDVGLAPVDVFAFHYNMNTNLILMSFNNSIILGGVTYDPTDIVQFTATSLGPVTDGTFSMYFNGADVGLDASSDYIDAIERLPDGKVLISTRGNPTVTGPTTTPADEDILAFTPVTLGDNTSGTWALYFDGSDVGLADNSQEDVDALGVGPNGVIYLSTLGDFSVTNVSGSDEDIFSCTPGLLGDVTTCNSFALYFDGSTWGLTANDVDAFNFIESGSSTATPTNTPLPTDTPTPTNTPTPTDTPTNTPTATATFTPTDTATPGPSPTPTDTPTPTNTASVPDLIFVDGFESGNLSAWTSSTTDLGDLSVSASAALVGSQGMQAVIDDTIAIYVTDDNPAAEPRYRARFYFDPNSIPMTSGDAHHIFKGFAGNATQVVRAEFRQSAGIYEIRASLVDDASTWMNTNWFTVSDVSHFIELDWRAATASGANDGGLTLWIDGVQQEDLTGVDNDTRRIDRARLGAIAGLDVGTNGTYYFDAFESRRQNYIGP